ncbi:hypothetical protein [Mediterraneibacter agrestimuris]|uniref:hypothetical protein n=1 Tax=Mediterraneibacter agrestimuris TaxID=2941333 RepID=UPI00203CFC27|nr:hypothetical protein [Mediterraneibacter agrestimuris]
MTIYFPTAPIGEMVVRWKLLMWQEMIPSQGSVFSGCSAIEHYYMMLTIPPTLENVSTFTGISEICKIHVPKGCLEAYQTAEYWSEYADHMVEIEE